MRKIAINAYEFAGAGEENKFIILGSEKVAEVSATRRRALNRIARKESGIAVRDFWGTLGYADDKPIDWKGSIEISSYGNRKLTGIVGEEAELIGKCIPDFAKSKVIAERFISFQKTEIPFPEPFSLDQIPKLRLELMLGTDEGAIVFYQFEKNNEKAKSIEYIQPQATQNNNVDKRDRLTYIFDAVPKYALEPDEYNPLTFRLSPSKSKQPFIIKAITFKRISRYDTTKGNIGSPAIIERAEKTLNESIYKNLVEKSCGLLVYNRRKNDFETAVPGNIDPAKKTLFLMHGTFTDTQGSFGDLLLKKNGLLAELTNPSTQDSYGQAIAFDHPTVLKGAEENITRLFECLDALNIGSFLQPVDFIATSQGGLLVQYLANMEQTRLRVGKAALIASANGVGYFTAGKYVSEFLSVLRKIMKFTGNAHLAIIPALAQHSTDLILSRQGFQIMTPGHEKLDEIINNKPFSKETTYLPIISTYDSSIIKPRFIILKPIETFGANIVYEFTKALLGEHNDWVVSTKNQFMVPHDHCAIDGYNPGRYREYMFKAFHGKCLQQPEAVKTVRQFLIEGHVPGKVQEAGKFDAHLHVFGRNIITGRTLYLLINDILHFKKDINSGQALPDFCPINKENADKNTSKSGSALMNVLKFFTLYTNGYKVLDSLEGEYYKLNSGIYRYAPLMFDLEMTFRSRYHVNDSAANAATTGSEFISIAKGLLDDIDKLVEKLEKSVSNDEIEAGIKFLKALKCSLNVIDAFNGLQEKSADSYFSQISELKTLKMRYGDNIYPFLAVDPRRENIAAIILENVGKNKPFHGIKLYPPNGYSPTDPKLFDDSVKFINGMSLYSYCIENNIPVMTHCSNAGFASFVENLEVWGDIHVDGHIIHYDKPEEIVFSSNNPFNFGKAVRERASVLNHPKLWKQVLEKHKKLKICFAHFGGESDEWRGEIAELIRNNENAYTDLSCIDDRNRLENIRDNYFNGSFPSASKIMYGSDFYLNMLGNISFDAYYKNFAEVFSRQQIDDMSIKAVERFLLS